jgi:hypothetical protein
MADPAPFQPDQRYEKMLELLDRAMKGDKEILAQIIRRGGFSKEELAPIQDYATRKWASRPQSVDVSGADIADLEAAGASRDEIVEYQKRLQKPVDVGAQYGMFLREEIGEQQPPAPASQPAAAAASKPAPKGKPPAKKPAPKKPPVKMADPLPEEQAGVPEAQLGAAALRMLQGAVPMPHTVMDPYGRPIDSPADQLEPTDDPIEIARRIEEGKQRRAQLQERYKNAQQPPQ